MKALLNLGLCVLGCVSAAVGTNIPPPSSPRSTRATTLVLPNGERVYNSTIILGIACRNGYPYIRSDAHSPTGGEPVDLQSGVFTLERTDLVVPGLLPIAFKHVYRTADNTVGRMGVGCSDGYDYRIRDVSSTEAWLCLPSNTRYQLVKQPDGSYINTNTFWLAGTRLYDLGQDGDARFSLCFKDGTRFLFASFGWGVLTYIVDANGNKLELHYDGDARLTELRPPSGRSIFVTVSGNDCITRISDNTGRSVNYVYDGNLRLVAVTNAIGGVTSYGYTNNLLRTITLPNSIQFLENVFDATGRVVTQIVADAGIFSFSYAINPSGVVTQSVTRTPLGNATTYNFSATGYETSNVDALGNTNIFIRDPNNGMVTKMIDPLVRTNSFAYDANFNLITLTNAQNKVTKFTYETTFNRLTSVIDPLSRTNSFGYDSHGNLTAITNALSKVTRITYNNCGLPTSVLDPLSNVYSFTYNEMFDLVTVTDPLSNQVKRAVDSAGRPYALIDPFGRATRINYDALNRVTSIVDPLTGTNSFGYDSVGNLTNVTDALSHSVSYGYDNMNRLTNRTDQLARVEMYRYDKNGNVTNFVDRRGISVAFKYDALDRRTNIAYATESNVALYYDKVSRVTNVVDSIAGSMRLTYDTLDRLTQVVDINGTLAYGYNDVGLRTNMTVTGETAVAYKYDAVNRLTNVVQGTYVSSLFYDDAGRRTNLTLPNGVKVLYLYDSASRLTNLTYQAAVTNKIDYAYDDTGNRVAQMSALAIYNLPSAIATSAYNAANQQLTFGGYTIQYDNNGNATNIVSGATTNRLQWNARNQLTNVVTAITGSFVYDGLGRRITRTVGTDTEKYLYDGLDIILAKNSSDSVITRHFRGLAIDEPWQRIDVAKKAQDNTNRVYLADALGSIVALTDPNKAIQTEYDYEPFGTTTTSGQYNRNAYKFTAREDDGTGLYFYRARYYHPVLGRFVSEDSVRWAAGDANLYGYVFGDPLSYGDPLGWENAFKGYIDARRQINEMAPGSDLAVIANTPAKVGEQVPVMGKILGKGMNGEQVTSADVMLSILDAASGTGPALTKALSSWPGRIIKGLELSDPLRGKKLEPDPGLANYMGDLLSAYVEPTKKSYATAIDWSVVGMNIVSRVSAPVPPQRLDGPNLCGKPRK